MGNKNLINGLNGGPMLRSSRALGSSKRQNLSADNSPGANLKRFLNEMEHYAIQEYLKQILNFLNDLTSSHVYSFLKHKH